MALALCDGVAVQLAATADERDAVEPADAPSVLLIPTLTAAARSAGALFAQSLSGQDLRVELSPDSVLAAEVAALVQDREPLAVVIGVISDAEVGQARLLCLRLRAAHRDLPIVVGLWYLDALDDDEARERLIEAGANQVVDSFEAARAALQSWQRAQAV